MILSSSELEGSRSRNISPVTSGGRESSVTKFGVMWSAVALLVEGMSAVCVCVCAIGKMTSHLHCNAEQICALPQPRLQKSVYKSKIKCIKKY